MPPKKPSATRPEISPLSLARILWKRKFSLLAIWIALSAICAAVVYKLPTLYSSEAVILVESQKIPDKYVTATVNTEVQDRLATISQQVLSSSRIQKIIEDFGLYQKEKKDHVQEEILDMMRKDITIKLEKGWTGNRPGAFRVGYVGPEPALVAQVANRIANVFIEENLRTREVQAEGTAEFIDTQLQDAKKKLDELEAAVSQYKLQHYGELPQQENSLIAQLSRLQMDLQANRDAIGRAQQSKLLLESTLRMAEDTATLVEGSVDRPVTASAKPDGTPQSSAPNVRKSSDLLQDQLDLLTVRYGAEHPDVKRLRAELARVKSMEEKHDSESAKPPAANPKIPKSDSAKTPQKAQKSETARKPAPAREVTVASYQIAQARERVSAIKSQLAALDKELDTRTAEESRILRDIKSFQSRLERLPVREQEMSAVTRDYEITKANYKALLDKRISAGMATEMERRQKSERFTMLDPARVPERPSKPNRPLFDGVGCAVALAIAAAVALGRELKNDYLLGEWELPGDIPVLGRVPNIKIGPPAQAADHV